MALRLAVIAGMLALTSRAAAQALEPASEPLRAQPSEAVAPAEAPTQPSPAQPSPAQPSPAQPSPAQRSPAQPSPAPMIVDDGEEALRQADSPAPAHAGDARWGHLRSRHDLVFGWAPRYRLEVAIDPLGLEQQLWRRVDLLPLYHRIAAAGVFAIDERTSVSVHFAAWGSLNLLEDAGGGLAAGDVAIGFVELDARPVSFWAGRRFLPYGPPGGLHVDGVGGGARSDVGLFVEAFVGRPVTPAFDSLLGPQPDFHDAAIAFAARVGYSEPGTISASASYAEIWSHGILGSRTVDVATSWDPGPLHVEGGVKIDAVNPGVVQARVGVSAPLARELTVDTDYLHVEPGRWIPSWSILSVFETSTFDELSVGATVRPTRTLAVRAEVAGRVYTNEIPGELLLGYRADLSARLVPGADDGPALRVVVSRRDDGVLGYTVLQAGTALDLLRELVLSIDGALALDDAAARLSAIARASLDLTPWAEWTIGATGALAHTPFAEAEVRAMLRLRWVPVVR